MTGWPEFESLIEPTKGKAPKLSAPPSNRLGSVEWDGRTGEISSGAVQGAANWDDLIRQFGLDPDEVEVVEPVRRSSWEAQTPDGIQILNSYRARLQSKRRSSTDIEQILAEVVRHRPPRYCPPTGSLAFLHVSGDLQMGKEGSAATIQRFLDGLASGPARLKELRKSGRDIGEVWLPWTGDCLEHVVGSYAAQTYTVELSLTEQIRVLRRLFMKMIQVYAPLCKRLVVPVVPGNHDIALRNGAGRMMTNVADSFATEIASIAHDMAAMNPDVYGHVEIYVPNGNDPELTMDVCGTMTAFAHGHTFSKDIGKWWAGQALGDRQVGRATLLIAGHLHHVRIQNYGPRDYIQIPALDSGSEYFAHSTGMEAPPGIVTLVVGGGSWDDFKVL